MIIMLLITKIGLGLHIIQCGAQQGTLSDQSHGLREQEADTGGTSGLGTLL